MFQPKLKEATKVTLLNPVPTLIVSQMALDKMQIYIETVDTEIGWLGTLIKESETRYYLEDVFLLEQECHGTNTTITSDGQTKLIMELMENDKLDLIDKMKFWGHSHVNMDVSPSGQDEDTLKMLKPDQDPDYFLRGIFNKAGKVKFTLYDYINGMIVDNLDWKPEQYLDESLIEQIKQEIEEKVTTKTYVFQTGNVMSWQERQAMIHNRGNLPGRVLNRFPGLRSVIKNNADDAIVGDLDDDAIDEEEFLDYMEDDDEYLYGGLT